MEQVKRITSALILLPPLVFFLLHASPVLFLALVLMVIGLSLREYVHLLRHIHVSVCTHATWLAVMALPMMAHLSRGSTHWLSMTLFFSIVALTLSVMLTASQTAHFLPMLVYSVFGMLFLGWTLSHLILLRLLPAGPWYILFLCAVVWVGDTAAMYVGKSLGQHKMAPAISPGKTWEGAIGCVIGGVCTAVVSARFWLPDLVLWQCIVLGLCISLSAQLSDLGESMLKRYAGVKDSGGLIPGHGGMLDRIDSLLFATPTLVYALYVLLPAPSL
jgi:phosphatidate cytidylyltransferase